jgi:hypothetical protein
MQQEFKEVSLQTFNNGSMSELFDEELKKVLVNINDINVEADFTREITLKIKIKPSRDRRSAITSVQAISKLAPVCPHQGSVFLSFNGNKPVALSNDVRQTEMPFHKNQEANGKD